MTEITRITKTSRIAPHRQVPSKSSKFDTISLEFIYQELLIQNLHHTNDEVLTNVCNYILSFAIPGNSILSYIFDENTCGASFGKIALDSATSEQDRALIHATGLRLSRTKVKFLSFLIFSGAAVKNLGLTRKIVNILESVNKAVWIDFSNTLNPSMKDITVNSTLKWIAKLVATAERELKLCIEPLSLLLSMPIGYPIDPLLHNLFIQLAPPGFQDKESDIYYIINILQFGTAVPFFDPQQQHQWNTYASEMLFLFRAIKSYWPTGAKRIFVTDSVFESLINTSPARARTTINIPFKDFIVAKTCSKNTFSRIITTSNIVVISLWNILLTNTLEQRPEESTVLETPQETPPVAKQE